jgi:hypothetical protein
MKPRVRQNAWHFVPSCWHFSTGSCLPDGMEEQLEDYTSSEEVGSKEAAGFKQ